MVVTNDILGNARTAALNLFLDTVDKILVGDDNTTPTAGDTALGNELAEITIDDIDESVAGQVTYNGKAGISLLNGNTIREMGLEDTSTSILKARDLTVEQTKSSDQIFWFSMTVKASVVNI